MFRCLTTIEWISDLRVVAFGLLVDSSTVLSHPLQLGGCVTETFTRKRE